MTKMVEFEEKLKELQAKGLKPVDVTPVSEPESEPIYYDEDLMKLFEQKFQSILNDYKTAHAKRGCGIELNIILTKPNHADTFSEKFIYSDKLKVQYVQQIGTQGSYQKCIPGEKI